jgi:cytoskeletal protein CcmA (bactofilin family)
MFSKASNKSPISSSLDGSKPSAKPGIPSIISPDLRVNGDLVCSGDIQVDGWIEGDIQSRNVVVGEGATIHGAVQAENVRICGIVNGQIRADNVTLEKSARVTGDILHKSLSIDQGAFLEGMCKRIDSTPAAQIEHKSMVKDRTSELAKPLGSAPGPLITSDKASVN